MPSLPTVEFDVIVVGAGIVGCAAATAFANDGRKVLLIGSLMLSLLHLCVSMLIIPLREYLAVYNFSERDWKEPDRIVGELLQPGGIKALEQLGMQDCVKGIDAITCNGYRVIQGGKSIKLPYSYEDAKPGCAFHHGKFIMSLRTHAESCDNVTTLEGTVGSLLTDSEDDNTVVGVSYSTKTEKAKLAYAPLTVVADGCFSRFRKEVNKKPVSVKSTFVGLILEDCKLPSPNHGHVILAQPSPILFYQIGTHETRALIDIPGTKIPSLTNGAMQEYMLNTVYPQLPESIQPSFKAAVDNNKFRSMPNSFLPAATNDRPGMVLLGDANNMRHPLTGGGMTVGFCDVVRLKQLLSRENVPDLADHAMVITQVKKLHWQRKQLSSAVNILANALYALFAAGDDLNTKVLQDGCFGYFELGGICVSTPIGLLSGMLHSPSSLILHFFAVALYGMYLQMCKGPFYLLPLHFYRAFMALVNACVIVFPLIFAEIQFR
ncbi:squalene epoxidase-domain-containing protein [Chytriomyces cf. hyalinus JEL632]|nr:squalene epoxidase-domain-containing protein [Chytriomyces cf. hyalinus JEL632]